MTNPKKQKVQDLKYIVMFFPTSRGDDIEFLRIDENAKKEHPTIEEVMGWWTPNIKAATPFLSFEEAQKFSNINQELTCFGFSKVIELTPKDFHDFKNYL